MFDYSKSQPGHFYAVGVGPGAGDLLTLRAVRLIETADVIIAPRSCRADQSMALQTIRHLIARQEIVDHVYPMQRDMRKTLQCWMEVAQMVRSHCQAGKSVVQVTLGDPLIYSTSCYLLALLKDALPESAVHVVPGITAFQATAGLISEALTMQEDRMMLMPATDLSQVEKALDGCETLVLYKAGKQMPALADLLERRGLLDRSALVCYAELNGRQFLTRDLRQARDGTHGYMATVIVHVGRQRWRETKTI